MHYEFLGCYIIFKSHKPELTLCQRLKWPGIQTSYLQYSLWINFTPILFLKLIFLYIFSPAQSILLINCILLQRKSIAEYGPLLQCTKIFIISLSHYIETSQLICRANQLTEYSCFQKCEWREKSSPTKISDKKC